MPLQAQALRTEGKPVRNMMKKHHKEDGKRERFCKKSWKRQAMSWRQGRTDNNDGDCPVLPQLEQKHKPRPPGQELAARKEGKQQRDNSQSRAGKVADALHVFANKPFTWKEEKTSQNTSSNKTDIITRAIKGKAEE